MGCTISTLCSRDRLFIFVAMLMQREREREREVVVVVVVVVVLGRRTKQLQNKIVFRIVRYISPSIAAIN